jgi:hypothetical protein
MHTSSWLSILSAFAKNVVTDIGNDPLNLSMLQQTVLTLNQVRWVLVRRARVCMGAMMRQLFLPKKQLN